MKALRFLTSLIFFPFFSVLGQAPAITNFIPTSGAPGAIVVINGINFNSSVENNLVLFGSIKAVVTAATSTQLSVIVPLGASYQPIFITNLGTGLNTYSRQQFLPLFSGCGNLTAGSLLPKLEFYGEQPSSRLISSDIDGDGKSDIVVGNSSFSVIRNIGLPGSPNFEYPVNYYMTTSNFGGIAAGDLTGDVKAEVVVTDEFTHRIIIRKNNSTPGVISFGASISFTPLVSYPRNIAIGDIDGDGKADLVVPGEGPTAVLSILRNTTSGGILSFAAPVTFVVGSYSNGINPGAPTLTDFDGDGKIDVILENKASGLIFIYRNTSSSGTITLSNRQDLATPSSNKGISTGDVDGDGKPDVSVISGGNQVCVFRNTSAPGAITFGIRNDYPVPGNSQNVSIGNIDGDNKPDLVVITNSSQVFSVLKNNSLPGQVSLSPRIDYASGSCNWGLVGDFDNDNRPDVIGLTYDSKVAFFKNVVSCPPPIITSFYPTTGPAGTTVTITGSNFNSTATNNSVFFEATRASVTSASTTQITVTVPHGTTKPIISVTDLATNLTAHSSSPFQQTFCGTPLSSSSFAPKIDISTNADKVLVNDFDGDGKPDLIMGGSNTISIFPNSSSGSISFGSQLTINVPSGLSELKSIDVNGDGKPDLISESSIMSIHKNSSTIGSISFEPGIEFNFSFHYDIWDLKDMDSDGRPDLIVQDGFYDDDFRVMKNTSSGNVISFAQAILVPVSTGFQDKKIADIDNDGKFDLLIKYQDRISIYRNTTINGGPITFASKTDHVVATSSPNLSVGDVDGDGKDDLLTYELSGDKFFVQRNTGSAGSVSFAPPVNFTLRWYPRGLLLNDIDGDGKPEVSITSTYFDDVGVYKNTSVPGTISFAPQINFTLGDFPSTILGIDLNQDGKADMIVKNSISNTLSILKNTTPNSPNISITPSNPVVCAGSSLNLTASGASNYTWSPSTGLSSTSGSTVTANPTSTTTYMVSGTDTNGCSATSSQTVTVLPRPLPSISGSTTALTGNVITYSTQTSQSSYWWTVSSGGYITSGQGTSNVSIYWSSAGSQYVTVNYSSNGCSAVNPTTYYVTITNPPPPPTSCSVNITTSGDLCTQGRVRLTAVASGGTPSSYSWSTGESSSRIFAYWGGDYTVTVYFTNGCYTTRTISIPAASGPNCIYYLKTDPDPSILTTSVFPNPVDDELAIELTDEFLSSYEQTVPVVLLDQVGKTAFTSSFGKGEKRIKIKTSEMTEGIYILQIGDGKSGTIRKKVMVVHKN